MIRKYCFVCGGEVSDIKERSWWCDACHHRFYENPRPTADVVLVSPDGKILIVERAHEPKKGLWNLPGGFVEPNESLEQAVIREVEEELGITQAAFSKPKYVASYPSNYEWGIENYELTCTIFVARLKESVTFEPNDDVASAKLVTREALSAHEFSNPNEVPHILEALKTLKQ